MKTFKDITPELRVEIENYKAEARKIYDGIPFRRNLSKKYIEFLYKKIGAKKPVVVFAKDPLEFQFFNGMIVRNKLFKAAYFLKNKSDKDLNKELHSELESELESELRRELDRKLYSELYRELDSELNSELNSELHSELNIELESELLMELDSELDSELLSELDSELEIELRRELDRELESELNSELHSELRRELHSELRRELHSELDSELHSELESELHRELDRELHSELKIELNSELLSELDSELHSELYGELKIELNSELLSELDSELRSELDSDLHSELHSELNSELNSELDRELESELISELLSELHSELQIELDRELDSELLSELHSELDSELRSELKLKKGSHYLWICSPYTRVFLGWYHFINTKLNVEYSKSEMLNTLYKTFNLSDISRCYFSRGYCVVLRNPYKIKFNESNVLHNVLGPSYKHRSGRMAKYHVNGRYVPKEFIEGEITKKMILEETNEDLKAAMITIIKERDGDKALLDLLEAEIVDQKQIEHMPGYTETVRLYKTKEKYEILQDRNGNNNQPYCWSEMVCPSTGQTYLIENSADFTCAIEAIKWLRPTFVPQDLIYEWENFAN